ncbi:type IX secretion system plug protein domain-containing protein, partial [Flavobacterium sp.]
MANAFVRFLGAALLFSTTAFGQVQQEIAPPYNIKTVSLMRSSENVYPYFRLGEGFTLVFDDLFGNEANYYYSIQHCNY